VVTYAPLEVSPVAAFGTVNFAGQNAEHERITRAALSCAAAPSITVCFEPRSMDQLAGHAGTVGAVGAPDIDSFNDPASHCDDADFLNVPGYPQTRTAATAQLRACVARLRTRFHEGVTGASPLLKSDGSIDGSQVDLTNDCTFVGGFPGRAKCNAIEGLGRALHGAQDFYSHSNWTDQAEPGPLGIANPPGLGLLAPTPILDLRGTSASAVPLNLSTGFFKGVFSDRCPGVDGRVTHACLNKDDGIIDPVTGATSGPSTRRGMGPSSTGTNFQKAVTGAIVETRRQWQDFRNALIATYGPLKAGRMIRALTHDVP
jgi:hypothetical protein